MPRFRLKSQHYINDTLLEAGEVVGDDLPHPHTFKGPPSNEMDGVDEESQKIVDELWAGWVNILGDMPQVAVPLHPGSGMAKK